MCRAAKQDPAQDPQLPERRVRSASLGADFFARETDDDTVAGVVEDDSPSDRHSEYALNNDHDDRGVGNVIWDWLKHGKARFTNVRWYTDPDWQGSGVWQSTPW